MAKTCVLTYCIGEKYKKKSNYTKDSMKKYANKIGADFIIKEEININLFDDLQKKIYDNSKKIRYLKLNVIYNTLKIYDRVIYFDSSCLINKNTPNLFEIVPENRLGAVLDNGACMTKGYINSGMLVLSKIHLNLFNINYSKIIDRKNCGLADQIIINKIIKESWKSSSDIINNYYSPHIIKDINNINLFLLDKSFNFVGSQINKNKQNILDNSDKYFILHFTRSFKFFDKSNYNFLKKIKEIMT